MLATSEEKCKVLTVSRDFHLLKFNELQFEIENVVRNTFHEAQEEIIHLYPGLDLSRMSIAPKAAYVARPVAVCPPYEAVAAGTSIVGPRKTI